MNLARNDHMFNSKDIELDSKVYVVSKYLPELNSAFLAQNIVNSGARRYTTRWIGWSPPPSVWVTLNSNGCYESDRNLVGARECFARSIR